MNNCDSYNDWMSIFNNELKNVWIQERTELRKISMIYFAFQKELDELKCCLSEEVSKIKAEFRKKDFDEKRRKFSGLVQSEMFDIDIDIDTDKENQTPPILPLKEDLKEAKTKDLQIKSLNPRSFARDCTPPPQLLSTPLTVNSPVLNKNNFNKFKRKKSSSPASLNNQNIKTPKIEEVLSTPKIADDSNIMESSIIEDTPEIKIQKKSKKSRLRLKKRPGNPKLNKTKQNTTLTQMFFEPIEAKHIDSNLPSMTATEIINLINENSSESDAESDATVDDLHIPTPQNITNPKSPSKAPNQFDQEVVRGKDRLKLKGWSCKECEAYYEGLNLTPTELQKKMDQCSRHRSKFKPREETWDGFWDLTFGPTPRKQDDEKSVVLVKL